MCILYSDHVGAIRLVKILSSMQTTPGAWASLNSFTECSKVKLHKPTRNEEAES